MRTAVHLSDFKNDEFKGLRECCRHYRRHIVSQNKSFITFEGLNPYEVYEKYSRFVSEDFSALAIRLANSSLDDASISNVEIDIFTLEISSLSVYNNVLSCNTYPKNHIHRKYN